MTANPVPRDERTIVVEHASYRLAYLFLSNGLLVLVGYRSFVRGESSWDLFALIILGGLVATGYQASRHVLGWRWAKVTLLTMVLAALLAIAIVVVRVAVR